MNLMLSDAMPGSTAILVWELLEGDPEWEMRDGILVRINPIVARGARRNTVVANGKNLSCQRLFAAGGPPTQINTMAVGTDSTASASTQTQLNPSVVGSTYFQAFDSTPSVSAGVATCVCTIPSGSANFAIAEVGMFNGTVNGTSVMLDRIAPIGPITKSASFSLALTITYTQG